MLLELQIINFAIIDQIRIFFEDGLTVFTGETGAGKSMIIDAIGLLSGGRASSDYVRHGTDKAEIEGLFEIDTESEIIPILEEMGIDQNDHMIIVRREIYTRGKSICRINGKLVTLAALQKIGRRLIDIHGQHEHQLLMDPARHLPLIDRFGGDRLAKVKDGYSKVYEETAHTAARCKKYRNNEQQIAQRIDLLRYQIQEIRAANLKYGEEEELLEEKRRLANFEKVFNALKSGYEALDGENGGLDWIRRASSDLESVQDLDKDLKDFSEEVSNSLYLLEEKASAIRDYIEQMEYDPKRLDEIELRLNDIYTLKRKYGSSIAEILEYFTKIQKEYDELTHRDERYDQLQQTFAEQMDSLRKKALILSELRKKTIIRLNQSVNRELKDLYMEHAVFTAILKQHEDLESFNHYNRNGIDDAAFYISTNPGEPAKPLEKIASGGELSRIMLAVKINFKQVMPVPTIIFDEVDTGVSGRVAQAMAEKIFSLSKATQVFCITHLPQVAAMADHHFYIAKQITAENRTKTSVRKLNKNEKIKEIGRMISGAKVTDLTRQHARELLQMAEKIKG